MNKKEYTSALPDIKAMLFGVKESLDALTAAVAKLAEQKDAQREENRGWGLCWARQTVLGRAVVVPEIGSFFGST